MVTGRPSTECGDDGDRTRVREVADDDPDG
jgi:hypothetical protein